MGHKTPPDDHEAALAHELRQKIRAHKQETYIEVAPGERVHAVCLNFDRKGVRRLLLYGAIDYNGWWYRTIKINASLRNPQGFTGKFKHIMQLMCKARERVMLDIMENL